jgi:hypothetical protein
MGFTLCPVAVVAAPVDSVWQLLSEPLLYDVWWDARTERIVPEGKASPGQVLFAKTSGLGREAAAVASSRDMRIAPSSARALLTPLTAEYHHHCILALPAPHGLLSYDDGRRSVPAGSPAIAGRDGGERCCRQVHRY